MNKNIVLGQVLKIDRENVTIGISGNTSSKRMFKISNILFRGEPAPISLITINANVECIYDDDKRMNLIEVNIPSKLEILATFGIVNHIDIQAGVLFVWNLIEGYEITTNQLLYNNTPINNHHLQKYLHCPVYIFTNGDAFLEARLINQESVFNFSIDVFKKYRMKEDLTSYIYMRDTRLIIHYIPSDNVFYKGTEIKLKPERVRDLIGKNITVRFSHGKFIGEVDAEPDNEIYFEETKQEILSATYSSRIMGRANKQNSFNTLESHKSERVNSQKAYNEPARKIEAQQATPIVKPNYTARLQLGILSEINWYYYGDKALDINPLRIILIGIIELCYRFPDKKVCTNLYSKLNALIPTIGKDYSQIFTYLVTAGKNKSSPGNIEEFYKYIEENNPLVNYLAQTLIAQPINYSDIAEDFSICINMYTYSEGLPLLNHKYYPFSKSETYPVINFYSADKLYLLYSEEIMKYDGFDLSNWTLTQPYYFEEVWPLVFTQPEVNPDYIGLFESCKKIVESADQNHGQSINELIEALKSLKSLIPDSEMPRITELIKDISRVQKNS